MKKYCLFFSLALILMVSALGMNIEADTALEPLYTYDKLPDGSFGYNQEKPIMYYSGSQEQIMIPKVYEQEKNQMKSGWIATIFNINIPTPQSEEEFQKLYMDRLNDFVDWNMNAMIFQIRPLLDAYYPSEINPTSQYLSGKQGLDVDYDPLEWMIEKTHEKGLEYHAWLNPYRVTNSLHESLLPKDVYTKEEVNAMSTAELLENMTKHGVLSEDNFGVKNPEFVINFGGKMILNPGYPEVRQHVLDTVDELITNYDLDAIHFDDYFYPYGTEKKNEEFNEQDRASFEAYGLSTGKYEDSQEGVIAWRRDNVTTLIRDLNSLITNHNKTNKRAVQLGISPFGIWEHKANHPEGSNTPESSTSTYSKSIFADTKGWIDEEIIDYIAPQIYWSFDTNAAPYGEIARWWNNAVDGKNVKLYVGHPNYKYIEGWKPGYEFLNAEEINNQVKFNQLYKNIDGSILFSYRNMKPDDLSTIPADKQAEHKAMNDSIEVLQGDTFSKKALSPRLEWLSTGDVTAIEDATLDGDTITITDTVNTNARYYLIYRGHKDQTNDEIINEISNLETKIFANGEKTYTYAVETVGEDDKFIVTVLDRANVETEPYEVQIIKDTTPTPDPVDPVEPVEPEPKPDPVEPVEPKPEPGKDKPSQGESNLPATGMDSKAISIAGMSVVLGSIILYINKKRS
ncbi:family 10 glycosylhydrolase [Erysipelothrix urinaevulpis]|uniref:family 10 glycosylhydrolase n=1 Tax=Erysipelothrix urinaevulpis TaxID=2683717 RepID=UPI00135AEBDF|nr:family 10 glycosylhydrolase [Erysipelothrix urinaevulpis]